MTVRDLPQGDTYGGLDAIVNCVRADGIEVRFTDVGTAVSTYVFSRRAAPIQMWMEMGYPFWSIRELDWVLHAGREYQPYYGFPADRWSPVIDRRHVDLLVRPVTADQVAQARAVVPANRFLMACFTRLVKVTPAYVRVVRQLLRDIPGSHYLLVGGGISVEAERLASDAEFLGRVTLVRGMVDLAVYGRIVDVFLDTFPLSAGVVAVEMAVSGVPVVSLDEGDSDRDMTRQRDPNMVARSNRAYRAMVERLAIDPAYRESSRAGAVELGRKFTHLEDMMGMIEDGVAKAIDYVNAKTERTRGSKRLERIPGRGPSAREGGTKSCHLSLFVIAVLSRCQPPISSIGTRECPGCHGSDVARGTPSSRTTANWGFVRMRGVPLPGWAPVQPSRVRVQSALAGLARGRRLAHSWTGFTGPGGLGTVVPASRAPRRPARMSGLPCSCRHAGACRGACGARWRSLRRPSDPRS